VKQQDRRLLHVLRLAHFHFPHKDLDSRIAGDKKRFTDNLLLLIHRSILLLSGRDRADLQTLLSGSSAV
jgi:hypothetical protein